ncbi:MAG: CDP-diacylglycerol--glycerol-3-phosphate 3-phosphatidyltransferase [Clostridia bacterium]|nr:CDP-diacylglycerol--glycerol-3-phosphate 3-phosphatidyltransferase [Clostridia bacterium]
MNLPNKLTLARVIMAPLAMIFVLYPIGGEICARIIAATIFLLTAITDMLDGKIARKYNLITNFGKFMDPLADKFMVIGVFVTMCASDMYAHFRPVLTWCTLIVILRELAVTSLRLLVASSEQKIVVPANWLGKVKTVLQIVCIMTLMLEPIVIPFAFDKILILSWLTMALMTIMTIWSGVNYLKAYLGFVNPND